jgi:hypothetical protein
VCWMCVGCVFVFVLHLDYICVTFVLHLCYICITFVLHVFAAVIQNTRSQIDFSSILFHLEISPSNSSTFPPSTLQFYNFSILPFFNSSYTTTQCCSLYTRCLCPSCRRNERRGTNFSTPPSAKTVRRTLQVLNSLIYSYPLTSCCSLGKGSPDTFDDGKGNSGNGGNGGNGGGRDPRHALRVTGTPLKTPSKLHRGDGQWGGSVTER